MDGELIVPELEENKSKKEGQEDHLEIDQNERMRAIYWI